MKPKCEISSLEWAEMLKKELQQSVNAYVELCEKHKELKAEFNELKRENKQLQNNRDKAIELLNELSNLYDDNYTVSDKAKDIIDILKGDSDES